MGCIMTKPFPLFSLIPYFFTFFLCLHYHAIFYLLSVTVFPYNPPSSEWLIMQPFSFCFSWRTPVPCMHNTGFYNHILTFTKIFNLLHFDCHDLHSLEWFFMHCKWLHMWHVGTVHTPSCNFVISVLVIDVCF